MRRCLGRPPELASNLSEGSRTGSTGSRRHNNGGWPKPLGHVIEMIVPSQPGEANADMWRGHEYLSVTDHRFILLLLGQFGLFWRSSLLNMPMAAQRIFAFLALRGGMVKRATVAGTLWPEASESHACSNLRSVLSRLQGAPRKALETSKFELGLARNVTVDIRQAQMLAYRLFDRELRPDPSDLGIDAVTALSSDLLPDWYDNWVLTEAEDWRQVRLHALEALADRLIATHRWGAAAGAAGAAVRADPLRETARAALIQLHLAEGNQSEAVREFARYRALLHAELGLEPTPRLRHLIKGLPSS